MALDPTLISHLKQHRFRELKNTQVSVPKLLREEMFISNVAIKLLKPATLTLLVASIVGGCATAPTDRNNASHRPEYAECLSLFEENDAAITLAGVRDVQARQIPGFSFVRTDRFLSSLRGHLNSTVYKKTWIEHLARRDAAGRQVEINNLPPKLQPSAPVIDAIERCRSVLVDEVLADPTSFARLHNQAVVPDSYNSWARAFGLYPLTSLVVLRGVKRLHRNEGCYFRKEPHDFDSATKRVTYGLAADSTVNDRDKPGLRAARDALGIPLIEPSELRAMFA